MTPSETRTSNTQLLVSSSNPLFFGHRGSVLNCDVGILPTVVQSVRCRPTFEKSISSIGKRANVQQTCFGSELHQQTGFRHPYMLGHFIGRKQGKGRLWLSVRRRVSALWIRRRHVGLRLTCVAPDTLLGGLCIEKWSRHPVTCLGIKQCEEPHLLLCWFQIDLLPLSTFCRYC